MLEEIQCTCVVRFLARKSKFWWTIRRVAKIKINKGDEDDNPSQGKNEEK